MCIGDKRVLVVSKQRKRKERDVEIISIIQLRKDHIFIVIIPEGSDMTRLDCLLEFQTMALRKWIATKHLSTKTKTIQF